MTRCRRGESRKVYFRRCPVIMVLSLPPLAKPVLCPEGAKLKLPFEMGLVTHNSVKISDLWEVM